MPTGRVNPWLMLNTACRRRVVKLTADHRIASSSAERERLAQRGHSVRSRLYGLNISRMLGDRCDLLMRLQELCIP